MSGLKQRLILILSLCLLGGFLIIGVCLYWFNHWIHKEVQIQEAHRVLTLPKGSSLHQTAQRLHEQNIIARPGLWVRYAQLRNLHHIKAGEYKIPEKISPYALLELINNGEVIQYQITFAEGLNLKEWLALIHVDARIKNTLVGLNEAEIISALNLDVEHLEGWFFPDTYNWIAGDTDKSLLLKAHTKMRKVLQEEWEGRVEGLPYKNAYEALIMASIIEKETGAPHERGEIAGVFVRRLALGMRLQTDPTVIYGMGERYAGNITRRDLKTATPYNTYVIKGLPPTPIAMPGQAAIHAALQPAEGTSLYFVARGDGTHVFSDTVEEHNEAVKNYQLKRKRDYRSSPNP